MATLRTPWATRADLQDMPEGFTASPQEQDDALLVSSQILFNLTGERWPGIVQDVIRPQSGTCGCLRNFRQTGCSWVSEFQLPGTPVLTIDQVLLDGDLVSEDLYAIDDRRYLVYLPHPDDHRRGWPCCQRVDRDADQPFTWEVTYKWGGIPELAGVRAAAVLAYELILATKPKSGCRLPQRVQSVTRQGVSYVLLDPMNLFDKGRTGLVEVDLWLSSLVLGRTRRHAGIIDPHDVRMNGRRVRRRDRNPSS